VRNGAERTPKRDKASAAFAEREVRTKKKKRDQSGESIDFEYRL
jgi:hypothetical protein